MKTAQTIPAALRIAAYLRVSTDEQAESGLGIDAQRTQVRAMAVVKGYPAPTEYVDNGISGTKDVDKRPALHALMEDVAAGNVDVVVIPSLDRLGRKTRIILRLVEELAERNVTLVSCRESFDTSTPTGQFVLTILAGLAQMERDMTAARTKAALREHSKRDGEAGGKLPYGYVRTADGIVVDEEAVKVVKYIFGCVKRGDSLRAIAEKLNAKGIPSPRGGQWFHPSVGEVVAKREAYRGGKRGLSSVRWPVVLRVA
jgi:site-specific DNA recombinase